MMDRVTTPSGPSRFLAVATLAVFATGCAHVSREDFDMEMEQVRSEMRAGDQALASDVGALSRRVDGIDSRLDGLEAALRVLEADVDMRIQRLESSLRVHMPIHFGFDSAELDRTEQSSLERVSGVVRDYYPGALVTVEGFTDPAGSEEYNLRLGQRRADTVRGWLIEQGGHRADLVRAVSYGEDTERLVRPGESGPGPAGRENRRVVLVIDHASTVSGPILSDGSS